jgi:hypothetical protein
MATRQGKAVCQEGGGYYFQNKLLLHVNIRELFCEMPNGSESRDNLPGGPPPHTVALAPGNRSVGEQLLCTPFVPRDTRTGRRTDGQTDWREDTKLV